MDRSSRRVAASSSQHAPPEGDTANEAASTEAVRSTSTDESTITDRSPIPDPGTGVDVVSVLADIDPDVLVAIPAFDEAATVGSIVRNAAEHADAVLVVDDGSSDDTAAVARDAGAYVLQHDTNRGYGATLQTIFRVAARAGAASLVVIDGDDQHDADDIPKLVDRRRDADADVVIGSRFAGDGSSDMPRYRWFGIQLINVLLNVSTGGMREDSWVSDTQSGFRAYGPSAITSLAEDGSIGDDMGASTDILHHAHSRDYEVVEVGTSITYEVENASSETPVKHGLAVLGSVLAWFARDSPTIALGVPGVILTAAGLALVGFVLSAVSQQSMVVSAFFAGLATMLGLVSLGGALARRRLNDDRLPK